MQTLFHKNPYHQRIATGHSCMVRVYTKPEYQMMTPDTCHTQASVQITTKTPVFYFDVITTFCADTMIQWYNLQNDFSIRICTPTHSIKGGAWLHQQSQPPCQSRLVLILAGAVSVVWDFFLVQVYARVDLYLFSMVEHRQGAVPHCTKKCCEPSSRRQRVTCRI